MTSDECCQAVEYETIAVRKTDYVCPLCESYAQRHASKPVAVMCCEGACLRGEIARQAADFVCHSLAPEKTVRICLGAAFAKDSGQRDLVRNAPRVIALEGCAIECVSRMMKGVIPALKPEVIIADTLCDFNRNLFGAEEMPEDQVKALAQEVARKVVAGL